MRNVRVLNFVVCVAGGEIILRMGFCIFPIVRQNEKLMFEVCFVKYPKILA
jgi:hypothetical protein